MGASKLVPGFCSYTNIIAMNTKPPRRVSIGQALLAQQAITVFGVLIAIYLLFNPIMLPYPLSYPVEKLHGAVGAVFGGPSYLMFGKFFVLAFCIYTAFVLLRSQKEKLEMMTEAQREEEIRARMRKARNASQQRLNELIEEEARRQQEANEAAMADRLSREEASLEDDLAKSDHQVQSRVQLKSRVQNEIESAAAIETAERIIMAQAAVKAKPVASAPIKGSFVDKLQSELDQALAQSSAPPAIKPQGDKAKEEELKGRMKDSFVEKMQNDLDQALAIDSAPPPSAKPQGSNVKDDDVRGQKKESFVEKMQNEVDKAAAKRPSASLTSPESGASSMIPLSAAREAEERQRAWLQQLSDQVIDGPARARAAALESERRLREEQEEEYRQSLAADEARRLQFQRDKEAAEIKVAREMEQEEEAKKMREALIESRKRALAELPAEPLMEEGDGGATTLVLVRVRVLKGAVHQRRFLATSPVSEVLHWVGLQDDVPELGKWRLVTSFPRSEPQPEATLAEVSCGANAIALFVEEA